jgi:dTDP-glucose pyrophosphorylase
MNNIKGGIIAAGRGQRFKKYGMNSAKALIPVAHKPLLNWTLARFIETGIENIIVIFNKDDCESCITYINENFSHIATEIICKNTVSSFESFYEILLRGNDDYLLLTTVDSIFEPDKLKNFLHSARNISGNPLVLGISDFIDDEKPLYVICDQKGRVISLGSEKSCYVTCGVYFLHPSLIRYKIQKNYSSLRMFLNDLVVQGVPTYGVFIGKSVDVDHPQDIHKAEEFIKTFLMDQ